MAEGIDFISGLPHDILLRIASMIPFKEAIRTAILSNAWKKLWTPSPIKLQPGFTHGDQFAREKIMQIIDSFSMYYGLPKKFQLCLQEIDCVDRKSDFPTFEDETFGIVTKGTQGELYFDFSGGQGKWSNKEFNLILQSGSEICSRFSSLKDLQLRSVNHAAEILVTDLFSGCQSLESLRIEKCRKLQNIDIRANNCLRSLTIMDCFNICGIKVSAPGLKSFSYRGILPNTFRLNHTPHLVDAILNFNEGLNPSNDFYCKDVLDLLFDLKDVEILTISGWLLEWLCTAGVVFGRLEFEFSELKELLWIDCVMDARKRDSLACFLNMTPCLKKLFVKIDRNCRQIPSPFLHEYWHEPHLGMPYAEVKCNASPLKFMKTIEIVGFTSEENEVLLIDLLFHKSVNLKDLILISPEKDNAWRVRVAPRSQVDRVVRGNQKHKLIASPTVYSIYVLTEAKDLVA